MASIRETEAGTFEVLYRDPNNRQRSRTFKRKTDARNFAKGVDTDKARGDWLDPALGKRQVKFWADDWYSTVTGSPRTLDYYAGALRNYVLPAQVTDLAKAMPTEADALMVTFTAYTGLRAGEVGALRRMHFSGRKVAVYENVVEDAKGVMHTRATKNYTRRDVAMPKFLADRMAKHLTTLAEDDYVFPAPDGGQMRHTNWYERHYKPAVRAAETVPDELRFHDLRHTCAAMLKLGTVALGASLGMGEHRSVVDDRGFCTAA